MVPATCLLIGCYFGIIPKEWSVHGPFIVVNHQDEVHVELPGMGYLTHQTKAQSRCRLPWQFTGTEEQLRRGAKQELLVAWGEESLELESFLQVLEAHP